MLSSKKNDFFCSIIGKVTFITREVFTAVKDWILVFWITILCSPMGGYQCSGGTSRARFKEE
jgi:hypothetical protein